MDFRGIQYQKTVR